MVVKCSLNKVSNISVRFLFSPGRTLLLRVAKGVDGSLSQVYWSSVLAIIRIGCYRLKVPLSWFYLTWVSSCPCCGQSRLLAFQLTKSLPKRWRVSGSRRWHRKLSYSLGRRHRWLSYFDILWDLKQRSESDIFVAPHRPPRAQRQFQKEYYPVLKKSVVFFFFISELSKYFVHVRHFCSH